MNGLVGAWTDLRRGGGMVMMIWWVQLTQTEEFVDGAFQGNLGEVLIRCNNVLYIRGAPEEAADMS